MYIITLGLVLFLAAFIWGYREGVSQGRLCGLSEAPINLRMLLAKRGKCPICDASYDASRDYTPHNEME